MKPVPVYAAKRLTPAQIKAYRIADSQTVAQTEWNDKLPSMELADR